MKPDEETLDVLSVTITAVVAILAVALMVLNLGPGTTVKQPNNQQDGEPWLTAGGKAVTYGNDCAPITEQFDYAWLDFNGDGRLDYYDYRDVLAGNVDCSERQCDVTGDGLIDERDRVAFDLIVTRVYDYDGNHVLTRDDPLFLRDILFGDAACDANHVCDLNGDGQVCDDDLVLYTSLLFNIDNPDVAAESKNLIGASYLK